ncbi:hypothetical protein PoB_006152800 [Plakobranchus ocellatus]|uniref:Uncharacterized protein n=1 Tax=Plakobranchus ocellatus TaxID=259542 RepID=A0AAV4CSV9_9GAST|nr:hypothetical protein PoB_006152800 [Plakobranchus ocellatus]
MGQNSSTQTAVPSPRRKAKAPPTPAPPPKPPAYAVAENFVLPGGTTDMAGARRLLRPVSQELSKFHPDFADIFNCYDTEVDVLPRGDSVNDENTDPALLDCPNGVGVRPVSTQRPYSPLLTEVTPGNFQKGMNSTPVSTENKFFTTHSVSQKSLDNINAQPNPPKTGLSNIKSTSNGHIPHLSSDNDFNNTTASHQPKRPTINLRRSQSMEARPRLHASRNNHFHKRQLSVTPVIPEDPREHLYNVARDEPFSNAQPAGASLPLASSFDLDYSFNVTYAQLADYRRKQRLDEMGSKLEELSAEIKANSTVPKSPFDRKNIGEKSATRSVSTGSSETGVSKSKKKKAPAPPPPANVPPLAPLSQRDQSPSRLSMTTEPPADYDMGTGMSPTPSPPTPGRAVRRSVSSGGEHSTSNSGVSSRLAARNSGHEVNTEPATDKVHVSPSVPPPPPPPPPPAPPLPESPGFAKFPVTLKTPAQPPVSGTQSLSSNKTALGNHTKLQKSVAEAKAQLAELKKLEDILKSPEPTKVETFSAAIDNDGENTDAQLLDEQSKGEEVAEANKPASANNAGTKLNNYNKLSPPRMSSLLQHDIVLAAQARGAKIVKAKPPPVLEKPKDLSDLFREELAKAATAREERRSREVSKREASRANDESEEINSAIEHPTPIFQSNFLKVARKPPPTMAKSESKSSSKISKSEIGKNGESHDKNVYNEKGIINHQYDNSNSSVDETNEQNENDPALLSKPPSIKSEDMSISSSNASQRVFSSSWTPEDDLDSDDDIMNEEMPSRTPVFEKCRNVTNEGFKSSVIPTKIDNLKKDKSKKKKQSKERDRQSKVSQLSNARQQVPVETRVSSSVKPGDALESEDKDDRKFGSIRKFQNSVHKSVKNAFGSISKASGKLLKRRKSQDFIDISGDFPSVPPEHSEVSMNPNWALSDNNCGSLRRVASEGHMSVTAVYDNGARDGYKTDDSRSASSESDASDDDNDDIGDIDFAGGIDLDTNSKKSNSKKSEKGNVPALKRAGVAYMSPEGKIIVLPEDDTPLGTKERGKKNAFKDGKKSVEDSLLPAPKFMKKRNKKFPFLSSGHRQEKNQEAALNKSHAGVEHRRYSAVDGDSRRLQELEAQERLHRIEAVRMQEQISLLQRQQLQRSHADLNSSIGVHSSSKDGNSISANESHQSVLNANSNTPRVYSNGYLPSQHETNRVGGFGVVSSFPLNTSHLLKHNNSQLATTSDPNNYTAHSAPLVGGASNLSPAPSHTSNPFAGFTSQELAYLGEYMRVMGVTPPSTQQQWAVLLSTFSINNNVSTGNKSTNPYNYSNHNLQNNIGNPSIPQSMLFQGSYKNTFNDSFFGSSFSGSGPNLSQVMGDRKSLDSTITAPTGQFLSLEPASLQPNATVPDPSTLADKLSSLETPGHLQASKVDPTVMLQDINNTINNNKPTALVHPPFGALSSVPLSSSQARNLMGSTCTNTGEANSVPPDNSFILNEAVDLRNGQAGHSAGDGVRSVTSLALGATKSNTGVYGPMGFRQVSA